MLGRDTNIKKRGLILGMISIFLLTACSKDGGGDTPNPDKNKKEDFIDFVSRIRDKMDEKFVIPEGLKNNPHEKAKEISAKIAPMHTSASRLFDNFALFLSQTENSKATSNKTVHSISSRGSVDDFFKGYTQIDEVTLREDGHSYVYTIYESPENYGVKILYDGTLFAEEILNKDLSYIEANMYIGSYTSVLKIWNNKAEGGYLKIEMETNIVLFGKIVAIMQINPDGSGYLEEYLNNSALWSLQATWRTDGHGVFKTRDPEDGSIDIGTPIEVYTENF